jgi:hypothetical protein
LPLNINTQFFIFVRYVRVVYIKCSDSDGSFDAPDDVNNSLDIALQKLRFNALLLQTFMAEEMNKHGFGYQTFELEQNENGEILVHVFTSELTTEKSHEMNGDQLYSWFHKGIINEEFLAEQSIGRLKVSLV